MKCRDCGASFDRAGARAKYCARCRAERVARGRKAAADARGLVDGVVVCVVVTRSLKAAIDRYVAGGWALSRSEAVRQALLHFMGQNPGRWE